MDFALILLIAMIVTGALWLLDKLFLAPLRNRKYHAAIEDRGGDSKVVARPRVPILIEYARALFPVIALVFVLRSFIVEPFRIPSGSMIPTLEIGDFILVNKFVYGLRLPVVNKKVVGISEPDRGDVMVFRFPQDPKINFIKRVVGLPGDSVVYDKKRLFINEKPIAYDNGEQIELTESGSRKVTADRFLEDFDGEMHSIVVDRNRGAPRQEFKVPADSYFVMGDNRDFSNDSRGWGFVPEANIVGKAFFVWFSMDKGGGVDWARIGNSID